VSDFDGDGRVDLAVAQNGARTRLFRNTTPRPGLRVRLAGPPSNRDGIGSSVRVVYADGSRGPAREVQAGSGYWSQNGAVQVLGTDPAKTVEAIEVVWFDGTRETATVAREAGATGESGPAGESSELVVRHPQAGPPR
jgi:hypothetical protein